MVCPGLLWFVQVCPGLPRSVMFCPGLFWSALICPGLSPSPPVCPGLSWYVLVCSNLSWSVPVSPEGYKSYPEGYMFGSWMLYVWILKGIIYGGRGDLVGHFFAATMLATISATTMSSQRFVRAQRLYDEQTYGQTDWGRCCFISTEKEIWHNYEIVVQMQSSRRILLNFKIFEGFFSWHQSSLEKLKGSI